jgi:uncharacterized membrane protein/thiol-disulfide isomerase/thioredoxin
MECLMKNVTVRPTAGGFEMKSAERMKAGRHIATMILAAAGVGIMLYYKTCETECSYLRGDIFGIDLSYIGVAYMIIIIALTAAGKTSYVRALLAAGIGVEAYLIAFQMREGVFCPYCLSFAAMLFIAFIVNHEKSHMMKDGAIGRLLYGLGAVKIPPGAKTPLPLSVFVVLGFIFVLLTFSGSATPAYGAERPLVPSYGSGKHELIIFTDYFCPPCQLMESELYPAVKEFLSRGGVKVTFIDYPGHNETRLYAQYFLYAARAAKGYENVLRARQVLFSLARSRSAQNEDELKKALHGDGVPVDIYDLTPVYPALNKMINTYKVRSTPTCVIKYSKEDIRTYTGTFEIRNGLAVLHATLFSPKR